jgi:uncharacterized membrane protein (DUF485 family)
VGAGLSALYGGLISLVNTALVNRHINKQKNNVTISAQMGVGMMIISVVILFIAKASKYDTPMTHPQ